MRYTVHQHITGAEPIEAGSETTTATLYKNGVDESRIDQFIERGVLSEIPGTEDQGLPEPPKPAKAARTAKPADPAKPEPSKPEASSQLDELKSKAVALGLEFPDDIDAEALAALVAEAEAKS